MHKTTARQENQEELLSEITTLDPEARAVREGGGRN